MAITIRLDDDQELLLASFMKSEVLSTKSKAVLWLIENASDLVKSKKKLNAISCAHEQSMAAQKVLSDLMTR